LNIYKKLVLNEKSTCQEFSCYRIDPDISRDLFIRLFPKEIQGMEIHTSGPYTGTQVLYFAVKEGYLIKEAVSTKMTGNIEIPDQNMSFPVVMNITSSNGVVK